MYLKTLANLVVTLVLIFFSDNVKGTENDQLVAVAILYRHGDRSVISSYPNDPYHDEVYWPMGYGELLNTGKLRHFNLGKWLRNRYDTLLSKNYVKKEIVVKSSNYDRCLMSAASNLAGLYPPSGDGIWLEDLPWQPVPIHTTPSDVDPYLAMDKPCPRHKTLLDELKNNNERYRNASVEFHDQFDVLAQNSGWKNITLDNFQSLYTTFYVYAMHNKSFIPPWASMLDRKKFTYLAGLSFASETYTDELMGFKAGPFFHHLVHFFNKALKDTSKTKLLMMSAHDGTLVAALNTMGVYDYVPPEFASMIVWELYKDSNQVYYIKVYYKKPSRETIDQFEIPKCRQQCKYDSFVNYLSKYMKDKETWEKQCNTSP